MASAGMALGPLIGRTAAGTLLVGIGVPHQRARGGRRAAADAVAGSARAATGGAPWDLVGSLQILVGLTALVYAIKELARQDLSLRAICCSHWHWAWSSSRPICGGSVAANIRCSICRCSVCRTSAGAFAAACLGTTGAVGVELVLSQYLQLVEQRSPLQARHRVPANGRSQDSSRDRWPGKSAAPDASIRLCRRRVRAGRGLRADAGAVAARAPALRRAFACCCWSDSALASAHR